MQLKPDLDAPSTSAVPSPASTSVQSTGVFARAAPSRPLSSSSRAQPMWNTLPLNKDSYLGEEWVNQTLTPPALLTSLFINEVPVRDINTQSATQSATVPQAGETNANLLSGNYRIFSKYLASRLDILSYCVKLVNANS